MNPSTFTVRREEFERKFAKQGFKLLDAQEWIAEGRGKFASAAFSLHSSIATSKLNAACGEIASWMGGELYGTVNLDFSGDVPTVEMMVEL